MKLTVTSRFTWGRCLLVDRYFFDIRYPAESTLAHQVARLCERWEIRCDGRKCVNTFLTPLENTYPMAAKGFSENIMGCLRKPSISAGVGLMYRFDPLRVEVNFGVPLVASQSDGMRRGFQVGIGMEFL